MRTVRLLCALGLGLVLGCSPTSGTSGTRATITGRVVLEQGVAGANDFSRVRIDIGRGEGGVPVDAEGNFAFEDIEPDVYNLTVTYTGGLTLSASGSAYKAYATRVVAKAGGTVSLGDIKLELGEGSVTGSLTLTGNGSEADSPDDSEVLLEVEGTGEVFRTTVAGGVFTFPRTRVGRYRITVSKPGYAVPSSGISAQSDSRCGRAVDIEVDGAAVEGLGVTLERAKPGYTPGGVDVTVENGSTWHTQATEVSVRVQAQFPVEGRVWVGEGAPPAYTTFQTDGYVVPITDGRNALHAQFKDACGNESEVDTIHVIKDVTPPVVELVQLQGGARFLTSTTGSLLVVASDDLSTRLDLALAICTVDSVGVENCDQDLANPTWGEYTRNRSVTFDDGQGLKRVKVQLRDRAGHISATVVDDVELDTEPPANPVVTVDSMGGRVGSTSVTAHPRADGAVEMKVGVQSGLSDAPAWIPYAPTTSVSLPPGDGTKQVFARFRDAAGNETAEVSASVELDTTAPPPPTVTLGDGSGLSRVASMPLSVGVSGTTDIAYVEISGDAVSGGGRHDWGNLPQELAFPDVQGRYSATVHLVDAVGNRSPPTVVSVLLDKEAPGVPEVVIAGGRRFVTSSDGTATLEVRCSDSLSGVREYAWRVGSGAFSTEPASTTSLVVDLGDVEGPVTVEATCTDVAGHISVAGSASVTWDHSAPQVSVTITGAEDRPVTRDRNVQVDLTTTDANTVVGTAISDGALDCATASYTFPRSGRFSFTLSPVQGAHTVNVCARDEAGNFTAAPVPSNTLELDDLRPAPPTLTLAGGDGWSDALAVDVTVGTVETNAATEIVLWGDVVGGEVREVLGSVPSQITLTGAGTRTVFARVVDAAGNSSDAAQAQVYVDLTTPEVTSAQVGSGTGFLTQPSGALAVTCVDDVTPGAMRLTVTRDTTTLYDDSYRNVLTLPLGTVEGSASVTVVCSDPSGRSSPPATVSFTVDTRGPIISDFHLNAGSPNEPTASPSVTASLVVTDPEDTPGQASGVDTILVSEVDLDCDTVPLSGRIRYTSQLGFTLSAGEGNRTLYLCAWDAAGNVAGQRSSNDVVLDTVPPQEPTVTLGAGTSWVNSPDVVWSISSPDADASGYSVEVVGDLAAPFTPVTVANLPPTISLLPGEGTRTLRVTLRDPAGNRSPDVTVTVGIDTGNPEIAEFEVLGEGFVTTADGSAFARAECTDGSNAPLRLVVTDVTDPGSPTVVYQGPLVRIVPLALGPAEGTRLLRVRCEDLAGNFVEADEPPFQVDHSAPVVTNFRINGGVDGEFATDPTVTVHFDISDPISGVNGVALRETAAACAGLRYELRDGASGFPVTLSPGEGTRQLFLCARDEAGNTSAAAVASNSVLLDTLRPSRPTVLLGGGATWVQQNTVSFSLTSTDDDRDTYTVLLGGDLGPTMQPSYPFTALPANVELSAAGGFKNVTVQLMDPAGNRSDLVQVGIGVDSVDPSMFVFTVGDGSGYVRDAGGRTYASVACTDDVAVAAELTLRIWDQANPAVFLYDGVYRTQVLLDLGASEVAHDLRAQCLDRAGNGNDPEIPEARFSVSVDHTPPRVTLFTLNNGAQDEPTAQLNITVHLNVVDDETEVAGVALAEAIADCTAVPFSFPRAGDVGYTLSQQDGQRRLYLCAKDVAGNITATPVPSTNTLVLDTIDPVIQVFQLHGGQPWSTSATVTLTVVATDPAAMVSLEGDLAAAFPPTRIDLLPATITLSAGDGIKEVTAKLTDAAGHVSERRTARVNVDGTPPTVYPFVVGDNSGFVRDPSGNTYVQVDCTDGPLTAGQLQLRVTNDLDAVLYNALHLSLAGIDLGSTERTHTLSAQCTDPAGNVSNVVQALRTVTVDYSPPVVSAFSLNGGGAAEPTRDRNVTVHYTTSDNLSGVFAVALSETTPDCDRVAYNQPAAGPVAFPLSAGEGLRTVFLCARDVAGNTTAALAPANSVTLDTQRPQAPSLTLGNGSGWATSSTVTLVVGSADGDAGTYTLVVQGDVPGGAVSIPMTPAPTSLELTPGNGRKRLAARLVDRAGNESELVLQEVFVDGNPPRDIRLTAPTWVTNASGDTTVQVACQDDESPSSQLTLMVRDVTNDVTLFNAPYQAVAPISLGTTQGLRRLNARCTDPAGNSVTVAVADEAQVTLDYTPPVVSNFRLNGGAAAEPTRDRNVTVNFATSDNLSGVAATSLSESVPDCARVSYDKPTSGPLAFPLTVGDGLRTLYLCARDVAGNTTAAQAAGNSVQLDTQRPQVPDITLGDGSGWATSATVALDVDSVDGDSPTYRLLVRGDVPGGAAVINMTPTPTSLALVAGNGPKRVAFRLADPAGNESDEVQREIFVDGAAPAQVSLTAPVYVTNPQGDTQVQVYCQDGEVPAADLAITVRDVTNDVTLYAGAFLSVVPLSLGNTQGTRNLTVSCRDPAGNTLNLDVAAQPTVTLDYSAPTITTFILADGTPNKPLNTTLVPVTLDVRDAVTQVESVALAETAVACDAASYIYPAQGNMIFPLTPGDGVRNLYLCARDVAGNQTASAVAASNAVLLDSVRPGRPTLQLGSGSGWANTRADVPVSVVSNDASTTGYTIVLVGDFVGQSQPVRRSYDTPLADLDLPATGSGPFAVVAWIEDAAGNESDPVVETIMVDTVAPSVRSASVGALGFDGRSYVTAVAGSRVARVDCVDDLVITDQLTMQVLDLSFANTLYQGVFREQVAVTPSDLSTEGTRNVQVRCTDPAGNNSTPLAITTVVDASAPQVTDPSFYVFPYYVMDDPLADRTLNGRATNETLVGVRYEVTDAHAGPFGVRLLDSNTSCPADPNLYQPPGSSPANDVRHIMGSGDGTRRVYLCVMDNAGNYSAAPTESENNLVLDTQPPGAGSLQLESGRLATNSTTVRATVSNGNGLGVMFYGSPGMEEYPPVPAGCGNGTLEAPEECDDGNNWDYDGCSPICTAGTYPAACGNSVVDPGEDCDDGNHANWDGCSAFCTWVSYPRPGEPIPWFAWNGGPIDLRLIPFGSEGDLYVWATLVDDAGNFSTSFFDSIYYDTNPPALGTVVLAEGQTTVNTNTISVRISDTYADRMRFWLESSEADPDADCAPVACNPPGWAGFDVFSPATTFDLEGEGNKRVCYQFCDEAGNSSGVGYGDILRTSSRPVPELGTLAPETVGISPEGYVALSDPDRDGAVGPFLLTLTGRGIAFDTKVQIGDFTLDCFSEDDVGYPPTEDPSLNQNCRDDDPNTGNNEVDDTCDTQCVIPNLPDTIMRRAGTYVVRLSTPAPGGGTSVRTDFFVVSAPVPRITRITPRGVTQSLDGEGFPVANTVSMVVCGQSFMDNVQFQLGPNIGTVQSVTDSPVAGVCPSSGDRAVTIQISTAEMYPDDLVDAELLAVNPSPGGGVARARFGINPVKVECAPYMPCNSNLRATRAPLSNRRGLGQAYEPPGDMQFGELTWRGGTAAAWRNANGELLARFVDDTHGVVLPIPFMAGAAAVTLEDSLGTGPVTRLRALEHEAYTNSGRGTGALDAVLNEEAVGSSPWELALADFNGDGYLDVAVSDSYGSVVVRQGPGWGNGSEVSLEADYPGPLAVADVDMDGKPDLLFTRSNESYSAGIVSVRRGTGNATFTNRGDLPMSDYTLSDVEVADFNRDGAPDILTLSGYEPVDRMVKLRLGRGDGTFGPVLEQGGLAGVGSGSVSLEVGDLNNDTIPDYVSAYGNTLVAWLGDGTGTGTETSYSITDFIYHCTLGDFTADGAVDVACATSPVGSDELLLIPGRSDGTLDVGSAVRSNVDFAYQLTGPVDFNGDGHADLLVSNCSVVTVMAGNSTGAFTQLASRPLDGCGRVATGDFNLDGAPDVVVAGYGNAKLVWRHGVTTKHYGRARFDNRITYDATRRINHAALADVDHDGKVDMMVAVQTQDNNNGAVNVLRGFGHGDLYTGYFGDVSTDPTDEVVTGDFNGDGNVDLAWRVDNELHATLSTGLGGFSGDVVVDTAWTSGGEMAVVDLNDDGLQDLVHLVINVGQQGYIRYLADGTANIFGAGSLFSLAPNTDVRGLGVGDLNGDGRPDVAVVSAAFPGANPQVCLSDGTGGCSSFYTAPVSDEDARDIFLEDVDNNGFTDIVVTTRTGMNTHAQTAPWTFSSSSYVYGGQGEWKVQLVDLNGDGLRDLLGVAALDKKLRVALGEPGGGYHSPAASVPLATGAGRAAVADLDNDAAPDVVVPITSSQNVTTLVLGGVGAFTQELTDLTEPTITVGQGRFTSFTVHQAHQVVDRVALRLHLTGDTADLAALKFGMHKPNDNAVDAYLNVSDLCPAAFVPNGNTLVVNVDPVECPALSALTGVQREGNWELQVDSFSASSSVVLRDFAVITHGSFRQAARGSSITNPELLTLQPGRGAFVHGTTLGFPSSVNDAVCGSFSTGSDHLYEFVAPSTNLYDFQVVTTFDAALAILPGACSTLGVPLACADDVTKGSVTVTDVSLTAGSTYCVAVDAARASGSSQAGEYDLAVRF
ncbi:MAG: FG-GAP-like repeat-containing protein [Myxococcota bacterium]